VVLRYEVVVLCRQVSRSRLAWADRVVFAASAGLFSHACRLYWIVTSVMVLRWHRGLVRGHLHRRPSTRNRDFRHPQAGTFDGGCDMQQELVNAAGGDALGCSLLPGAGAKQEPRLFRDLPDLLPTAANGSVMCRGFSISTGQQIVEITLGVKWEHTVRSRGRRPCSGPLRSSSGSPVYWYEGGGGASPGLSSELPVPAGGGVGCRCW
jgi:hypothetical protein